MEEERERNSEYDGEEELVQARRRRKPSCNRGCERHDSTIGLFSQSGRDKALDRGMGDD